MTKNWCFNHLFQWKWGPNRQMRPRLSDDKDTSKSKNSAPGLWLVSSSPWKCQQWVELSSWLNSYRPRPLWSPLAGQFYPQQWYQLILLTLTQPLIYFIAHTELVWKCHELNGHQCNGTLRKGPSPSQVVPEKTKEMLRKKLSSAVVHGSTDRGWSTAEAEGQRDQATLSTSDLT